MQGSSTILVIADRLARWRQLPVNPCQIGATWTGVQCNQNRTAIIFLELGGYGLSGPLGNQLQNLQTLQVSLHVAFGGSFLPFLIVPSSPEMML